MSQQLNGTIPLNGTRYQYGDYQINMKTGFSQTTNTSAHNMVTCFSPTTTPEHNDTDPLHNEIALCIDGNQPTVVQLIYFYNQTAWTTYVNVSVDLSQSFHTYLVSWRPSYIEWSFDGKLIHRDDGTVNSTIPWENGVIVAGLLKPTMGATGTASLQIQYVSYTPVPIPNNGGSDNALSTGAIVGIVIACAFVVILVIFCCCRASKNSNEKASQPLLGTR